MHTNDHSTADTLERTPDRSMTLEEIRDVYAEQADLMDRMHWMDRLLMGRYRRRLFGTARGRVLDVACGMGTNRRYLPESVEYVGIDASPEMLSKARDRIQPIDPGATFWNMDAQALEFPDDSFDTVISSLSTCTFPDPIAALQEMERVCKPNGRILLLEHGRSDVGAIARVQDLRAGAHFEKHACRLNQEPVALVRRAGLDVRATVTRLFGILTAIDARPDQH
ncbi:class I SAM-dependent methyltransferase [Natrononativus amylolyticus]|uniref:class I SAM-dependent methyltransferase n=1 Tax=Natrononativus amylolyticus TaxID=2963434 RepID=UPI0020CCCB80|nr:class I SAM-dependent methyltransferase [Natrononativus amylolyticus]